jgi:glycosyltransferase involved in cell wall biosynthesis
VNADEPPASLYRVLATCDYYAPGFRGGGPGRSVAAVIDTASPRTKVDLIVRDRDLGAPHSYPELSGRWVDRARAHVFYLNVRRTGQWVRLWRALRRTSFDLLYVNSLWSPLFTVVPVVAVRLGLIQAKDIIVAPHGSFSPAALSIRASKKKLFLPFWASLLKSMNVLWQADSEGEAADIRAACPWAVVRISETPVAFPPEPLAPAVQHRTARLVYIGRIAAIKNLELTYRALLTVSTPLVLDIYGPVEDRKYWARCQALARRLPDQVKVRYLGPIPHAEVRSTFARYDAFVFPTLGESFGHIIAESLSASCPVICSAETPWTSVLQSGGGTVLTALTPECLGAEIDRLAASTPAERTESRRLSGQAYRLWRDRTDDTNILEMARAVS